MFSFVLTLIHAALVCCSLPLLTWYLDSWLSLLAFNLHFILAGDPVTFAELENSTILTLSIHLIGESKRQITRLFSQGIFKGGNIEYPMDVKITLKVSVRYTKTRETDFPLIHIR